MPEDKDGLTLSGLIDQLDDLVSNVPDNIESPETLPDTTRKKLRKNLLNTSDTLQNLAVTLDPVRIPDEIFDPSEPASVGKLIARTLVERPLTEFSELARFYGSGVYAIYYSGSFEAYTAISGADIPIYVGKVDPQTTEAKTPEEQGDRLWIRLIRDHAKNIDKAENLELSDFKCRYLVVKSAWQNTAESYLINWYKPAWNNEVKICFGFGKHGDKSTTRANTKSPWDTVHPGRPWAKDSRPNPKSSTEIIQMIQAHLKSLNIND